MEDATCYATNSSHLKNDGWKMILFLCNGPFFQGTFTRINPQLSQCGKRHNNQSGVHVSPCDFRGIIQPLRFKCLMQVSIPYSRPSEWLVGSLVR